MARIARVMLSGYPHHITQLGVRAFPVFFNDTDRLEYHRLLKEQGERCGIIFIAYCLMTNHVHLIAIPENEYCVPGFRSLDPAKGRGFFLPLLLSFSW